MLLIYFRVLAAAWLIKKSKWMSEWINEWINDNLNSTLITRSHIHHHDQTVIINIIINPTSGKKISLVSYERKSWADCPTIPISSGLSCLFLKIPNPDQYAIGIGKIPILTRLVIFSSNSHKRNSDVPKKGRNCKKYQIKLSTFMPKGNKVAINLLKIFDRICCVRTPEI